MHRPDEHRAASLGTPDEVVHDQVDIVPFMLVVHVDGIPFFNSGRKPEGPFIPRETGAFWLHFCKGYPIKSECGVV